MASGEVRVRWCVSYIDGDGRDDWQLMRNYRMEYFDDEDSANNFAKSKKLNGKQFYWQPDVWKEEEHIFSYPKWIRTKNDPAKR